jgi:uncharacterized protein YndB with AHSA1/START domain
MTDLTPTGTVVRTTLGADLTLTRTYAAPIADVWASVTEPERTARWFGAWRGEAGPGRTVQVQMAFEESAPWLDVVIEACTPPSHLVIAFAGDVGGSRLELALSEAEGTTTLRFTDHRDSTEAVGDYGCGWEWYLDGLTAVRQGHDRPGFDDYHAALKGPYDALARAALGAGA